MKRLLPQSLFGQTVLILLLGLALSHAIGAWFYGSDREQAVRAVGGLAVAQRIANNARLVEESPLDWRSRIVEGLNDPAFRVSLSSAAPSFPLEEESSPISGVIKEFIAGQLPARVAQQVHVAVAIGLGSVDGGPPFGLRGTMQSMPMPMMRQGMHGPGSWRGMQATVQLPDGQWLAFSTVLPDTAPAMSLQFILSMAIMAIIVLVVSIWAVRRLTAPLGVLAQAADRLGKDVAAAPIAVTGSMEMRQAALAFNRMQERLQRLIENRTLMLAAISHDIRTPLTLLRLRAEGIEVGEDRDRMLATIAEMEAMLGATLSFARDEAKTEPRRRVDLTALVASLVDDMADAGLPVSMEPAIPAVCECQSQSLKRALTNLIDNAIKYGSSAQVSLRTNAETMEIWVDDDGPGIPEEELSRVQQPFYRLESSRSRETGGVGLGLAIALSIVQSHGGQLSLSNKNDGGLRAKLILPH